MSWCNIGHRTPMPGGWTRLLGGVVTEVSLLSPGLEAYEPGAKVWHIERNPAPQPAREPVSEVIHNGGVLTRRNIEKVLAIRDNDGVETVFE
jgi:hypothetical protein